MLVAKHQVSCLEGRDRNGARGQLCAFESTDMDSEMQNLACKCVKSEKCSKTLYEAPALESFERTTGVGLPAYWKAGCDASLVLAVYLIASEQSAAGAGSCAGAWRSVLFFALPGMSAAERAA